MSAAGAVARRLRGMDTLVIITGGSSGLGRALLETAPPAAHRVDISRSGSGLDDVEHLPADLADPASWPGVTAELDRLATSRPWQRITLLHSAGTLEPIGFAAEVDPATMTANVLLNAAAPQVLGAGFLAAVAALPSARRELVLLSSGAARTAYPGWATYGAGKAAVDQWVRAVGEEQRQRGGIRVLSIAPGVVATGMQELIRTTDERDFPRVARFRQLHADGQLAHAGEVAARLWRVLDQDHESGAVLDLRDLGGS